jgi:cysteinyl-tRNA synthetase
MLSLYNSLSGHKEPFQPLLPEHVRMYVCGPTVYDRIHLGNARCMLVFDMLYRVLQNLYPNVNYVRNITDVDDKINAAAKEKGIPIGQLTAETTQWFHQDVAELGLLSPTCEPRATEYIDEMVAMIAQMVDEKTAYVSQGHVLFDVSEAPYYGQLSKMPLEDMQAGARIEPASYKEDPLDFVLWKPSGADEPGWYSPWGQGRPGWHIECSAMSTHLVGAMMDIHGGGRDLMFPHHENERAQSCACSGQEDCSAWWMHTGMLVVGGQKMSKSLGNFITLHDALLQQPAPVLRWALLTSHYRHTLDWTDAVVKQARMSVDSIHGALVRAAQALGLVYTAQGHSDVINDQDSLAKPAVQEQDQGYKAMDSRFWQALCDDLNTPAALNRLQQLARALHKNPKDGDLAHRLYASAHSFGLIADDPLAWFQSTKDLALSKEAIMALVAQRQAARAAKDFAGADLIRAQLLAHGVALEDSGAQTHWRVI